MKEFENPFPGWIKALVAWVMCVWLALVLWVGRIPGWVGVGWLGVRGVGWWAWGWWRVVGSVRGAARRG